MSKNKVFKTDYESDITQFLKSLPEDPSSPAVEAEKSKYERINELRDNPEANLKKSKLWEGF